MSIEIATMGMFQSCCRSGPPVGGGAPPVHQWEARGEDFPIHVDVLNVFFREPKKEKEITIIVQKARSERKL
jgi:hypothetical protein